MPKNTMRAIDIGKALPVTLSLAVAFGCIANLEQENTGAGLKRYSELRVRMPQPIKEKIRTIAVLHATNRDQSCLSSQFERKIGEQFEQTVFGLRSAVPTINVIERNRLDSAIKEHGLQATGLIKEDDIVGIGRMLGADHLFLYDSICTSNEDIERIKASGGRVSATISAKIIATQTGAILYRETIEQSVFFPTPPSGQYWVNPALDLESAAMRAMFGLGLSLHAVFDPRLFDGIVLDYKYEGPGALVSMVLIGSPADNAGIKPGDVVLRIDKNPITSIKDARVAFVGNVTLAVLRNGVERDFLLEMGH